MYGDKKSRVRQLHGVRRQPLLVMSSTEVLSDTKERGVETKVVSRIFGKALGKLDRDRGVKDRKHKSKTVNVFL